MDLLKPLLTNLVLLMMIAFSAFAQRRSINIYEYQHNLYNHLYKEGLQLDENIRKNRALGYNIFSPCNLTGLSYDNASQLARQRYNDTLLKIVEGQIADIFEDSILLKELTGDTIVSFKALFYDIADRARNYESSKIIYTECNSVRRGSGLSVFGEKEIYPNFEQNLRTDTFTTLRNTIPKFKLQEYVSRLDSFVNGQGNSVQEEIRNNKDLQAIIFKSCQGKNITKSNAEDLARFRFGLLLKNQITKYLDENGSEASKRKQWTGGIGISMYDFVNQLYRRINTFAFNSQFIAVICGEQAKIAEVTWVTEPTSSTNTFRSARLHTSPGNPVINSGPGVIEKGRGNVHKGPVNNPDTSKKKNTSIENTKPPDTTKYQPLPKPPPGPNPFPPEPTNWILIVFVSLSLLAITILFIFHLRKSRQLKIVAITIDETERSIAEEYIHHAQKTKGFTLGYASGYRVSAMRRKGLLVQILNTSVQVIKTPGNTRKLFYNNTFDKQQVIKSVFLPAEKLEIGNLLSNDEPLPKEDMDKFPLFYIISLDSPLMPDYSNALQEHEIDILQYLPDYNYIVCIRTEQQLAPLRDGFFKFIKYNAPFSGNDTGFIGRVNHNDITITVDLILHRDGDQGFVRESLFFRELPEIASFDNVLRTAISRDINLMKRLASSKYVRAIYEYIEPTLINYQAGTRIGMNMFHSGFTSKILTGKGEVIAIADSGIDELHPDIVGQVRGARSWGKRPGNDCSDSHGHGTHIAGTIAGTGVASDGRYAGIAPGAKIFFQSLMDQNNRIGGKPADIKKLLDEAYQSRARIFNLSWGANYNSQYETDSENADAFAYKHKGLLIVAAAGNDGKKNESGATAWYSINAPGTVKNGITAGVSCSGNIETLDVSSSRGPCSDGRIKPDLVVPASTIESSFASTADRKNFLPFKPLNKCYGFMGGASMAAAIISGAAAVIREGLLVIYRDPSPSAALVKAILINSSRMLTGKDALRKSASLPNNSQGFGMLDLSNTLPNYDRFFFKYWDTLNNPLINMKKTGDGYIIKVKINNNSWIRACLSYTDIPGAATQIYFFLAISYLGKKTMKWVGNKGFKDLHNFIPKPGRDGKNNVEIIRIDKAPAGEYAVKVFGYNLRQRKREDFALVITAGDNSATIISEEMEDF